MLGDPRDVFNLTVDEVLGAVEGAGVTDNLRALAKLRDGEMKASLARPDPPERFTIAGAHAIGAAALKRTGPGGAG